MTISSTPIKADASAWSSMSLSARLSNIGNFIADTPTLLDSVSFIQECIESHGCSPEGEISFLLGETRAGKTTAVETAMRDFAEKVQGEFISQRFRSDRHAAALMSVDKMTRDGIERPVFAIEVPKAPTFKGLLADVLAALGVAIKGKITFGEQQSLLCAQLVGQRTKLLIFDDAQHVCESGKNHEVYAAADVFKLIAKVSGVQILCVGLPHTLDVKTANPQVKWIGGVERTIEPLAIDANPASDLAILCATLNKELPFEKVSHLSEPEVFVPLAIHCGGYEGRIATIVRLAARHAIRSNRHCLDRNCLTDFLREMRGVPDALNPFLLSAEDLTDLPNRLKDAKRAEVAAIAARLGKASRRGEAFSGILR
ncbi:MAG: hypothetical protein DI565_16540 [Ancylobacter novellus]|jgi:hypothetical protein|uniref:AAA+ ATPase domain-containing protein n=1 Tax=Ancylobacter novellus TaxID=921 RepID=A0A2W5KAF5_ANCNO|nr:MAG: hypothetical protein DI565_16540 [Ancylobacter novellus]